MGFWRGAKKVGGLFVNVEVDKWIGYDNIKRDYSNTKHLARSMFTPEVASRNESFEEALVRLNITEEQLKKQKKDLWRTCILFLLMATGLFIYLLFHIVQANISSSIIIFSLMLYCLAQAYKFHFWVFQISQRKLGCTFKEWLNTNISV